MDSLSATVLYTDERTFWHTSDTPYVHTLRVGGWVQPSSSGSASDSADSKRRLLSLVQACSLADGITIQSAPPATYEDLVRVHDRAYLAEFKRISDLNGGDLGDTAPFARGGYEIAAISAGLAKAAIGSVVDGKIKNAYSLSRPAGHHCLRDRPMGYCLLANIPIGIEAARATHGVERVAIVDWDVHHGNGAQSIYYGDPNILTISLHQERNFPFDLQDTVNYRGDGAGVGSNINVPLPPGCGDEAYAYAMERIVLPALRAFQPDLIVVACGFDACALDPMGRMLLHSESYRGMTQSLLDISNELCGGRLAVVHEGGYSEVYVPFCGLAVIETLAGTRTEVKDPLLSKLVGGQPTQRVVDFQKQIVDEMTRHFA